jgi:peptide/nickel transport system permease protein
VSLTEIESREVMLEGGQGGQGGLWADAFRRLRRNPSAVVGAVLVGIFVFIALFAPLLAPYDPRAQDLSLIVHGCCPGPSWEHLLGVDDLGRDELSRILYGARLSLLIGIVSVTVGLSLGIVLGSIAGFFGGWVDGVLMRFVDIMLAIPGFLMAIGIVNVPIFTRLLRGSVLSQRENDFVLAARSVGVRRRSILVSHVLPNSISPVIVGGTLALATAIIDAAGLGFLGLGPQDPATPEWGTMLTDTVRYLQTAPMLAVYPGVGARLQPDR